MMLFKATYVDGDTWYFRAFNWKDATWLVSTHEDLISLVLIARDVK